MADIEVHRVHNLGLKAAREAADKMAEVLGRKFDLRGQWSGNVFRFERPGVTGSLSITDKELDLSVGLGLLLKMMRGPIAGAIEEELNRLFAQAQPTPRPRAPAKPAPAPRKKGG